MGPLGTTLGEGCRVLAIVPSEEAGWFTLEEMARLPLRSAEVLTLCHEVARGVSPMPLDALMR